MNTKKCKYCQADIDKKAKICPACGRKQPGKGKFILIAIVVIIIIAAIGGGTKKDKPKKVTDSGSSTTTNATSKTTENKTTEEEKTEFGIGEAVVFKDVEVTLISVEEIPGSEFIKPDDGKVFVAAEFEITNNSDKEITVSSLASFDAYVDDYSTNVSFSALTSTELPQLDGTIAPGKKMHGAISFELASDWKELEIRYSPSFWSGKDMIFKASH